MRSRHHCLRPQPQKREVAERVAPQVELLVGPVVEVESTGIRYSLGSSNSNSLRMRSTAMARSRPIILHSKSVRVKFVLNKSRIFGAEIP